MKSWSMLVREPAGVPGRAFTRGSTASASARTTESGGGNERVFRASGARLPAASGGRAAAGPRLRTALRLWLTDRTQFRGTTKMKLARYTKFREEKFGGVLFETRSEKVFALNPTATAIVREISAGRPEGEVAARLAEQFSDSTGGLESEVGAFIARLREQGLVED
jgi:hypothetical protein